MKRFAPAWFGGAAMILAAGFAIQSADLMFVALAPAAVGLGTLLFGLKDRFSSERETPSQQKLHEMEERLRLTAERLDSTTRDLAALKEQRELDTQRSKLR